MLQLKNHPFVAREDNAIGHLSRQMTQVVAVGLFCPYCIDTEQSQVLADTEERVVHKELVVVMVMITEVRVFDHWQDVTGNGKRELFWLL